jgi:hypothetical protein
VIKEGLARAGLSWHALMELGAEEATDLALSRVGQRYEKDPNRRCFEEAMESGRLRAIECGYDAHHAELGARIVDLALAEILKAGESLAAS